MRVTMILLALAGLCACDRNERSGSDAPSIRPAPAAFAFDGADATTREARLKHGERLAWILGCKGCHGSNMQGGNVTKDDPGFGDMNAPNVTLKMAEYSDAELDQLLRHGKPKDGREFWFMPVESYQFLADADVAALTAYLRTLKPEGKQLPPIRIGEGLKQQSAAGILVSSAGMLKRYREQAPPDLGERHAYGRQLSRIVCAECHNSSLQGFEGFTPDLDIAGAYSATELETLLTTGKGKTKADLGLMSESARHRFARMTPHERSAVIAYVKARAERPGEKPTKP